MKTNKDAFFKITSVRVLRKQEFRKPSWWQIVKAWFTGTHLVRKHWFVVEAKADGNPKDISTGDTVLGQGNTGWVVLEKHSSNHSSNYLIMRSINPYENINILGNAMMVKSVLGRK